MLKFPKLIVGYSEFSCRLQFYRSEWAQTKISAGNNLLNKCNFLNIRPNNVTFGSKTDHRTYFMPKFKKIHNSGFRYNFRTVICQKNA